METGVHRGGGLGWGMLPPRIRSIRQFQLLHRKTGDRSTSKRHPISATYHELCRHPCTLVMHAILPLRWVRSPGRTLWDTAVPCYLETT